MLITSSQTSFSFYPKIKHTRHKLEFCLNRLRTQVAQALWAPSTWHWVTALLWELVYTESLESLWNPSKRHKNTSYTHNKKDKSMLSPPPPYVKLYCKIVIFPVLCNVMLTVPRELGLPVLRTAVTGPLCKKCIRNWPLPIGAFHDQKRRSWTRGSLEQHQLAVRTRFEPATYGFQIRRSNHSATLKHQQTQINTLLSLNNWHYAVPITSPELIRKFWIDLAWLVSCATCLSSSCCLHVSLCNIVRHRTNLSNLKGQSQLAHMPIL